jgi:hypothetical protein
LWWLPWHLQDVLEPGPDQLPQRPDDGWQVVGPFVHGSPSPVVELHRDPLPGWWEGPYRQDVPK